VLLGGRERGWMKGIEGDVGLKLPIYLSI
jgi:hypothetical protein